MEEKERFRTLMRMMENFTGCRVLSYCLICNQIHILLEVPPMPEGGLPDAEFLKRLSVPYGEVVGGGPRGNGKMAREVLVRAITSDADTGFLCRGMEGGIEEIPEVAGDGFGKETFKFQISSFKEEHGGGRDE